MAGIQHAVPLTCPVPRVTSPGLAANLSKSILALPAPWQAEEAWGEAVQFPQHPGDGGAAPAPPSPQLCLSPSIMGWGSLPSQQGRGPPQPQAVFGGERLPGVGSQGAQGRDGTQQEPWDAMGGTGSPPTPEGSREGAPVGSAGMETWEGASVPTTPAHPGSGTHAAWPASPVTCCCRAGQEPRAAPLPLALVNSLWRCIFNSFTEPI